MCLCVRARERESACARELVCVHTCVRAHARARDRMRERERESYPPPLLHKTLVACVYVCARECVGERGRDARCPPLPSVAATALGT